MAVTGWVVGAVANGHRLGRHSGLVVWYWSPSSIHQRLTPSAGAHHRAFSWPARDHEWLTQDPVIGLILVIR